MMVPMLPSGLLAVMRIGMSPNILHIRPFLLTWHAVFGVLAVMTAVWLTDRWGRKAGLGPDVVQAVAVWAILGGLIGARVVAIMDDWAFYSQNPIEMLKVWQGGIAIYGAFGGGVIAGTIYSLLQRYPVRLILDLTGPTLLLAQAIGRIGDVINGEHYSTPTDLPWGVVYTNPESPAQFGPFGGQIPTHPAVAYEILADLAAFGLLLLVRNRLKPRGAVFALAAAAYSVIRLSLSFIRLDSHSSILGLNQQGFIAAVVLVVALASLVAMRARFGKASQGASGIHAH